MQKENGSVSVVLAIILGLLFVSSSVFAVWAFAGMQDYKNNTDEKIADASAVAVQEAETAKDVEFVEKEKSPLRTYTGPATYGSVSFEYPKTWSVYAEEKPSGTVLNLYTFPGVIPGFSGDKTYALRLEITSRSYDAEVKSYEPGVKSGAVTSKSFRLEKVSDVLGLRIDGEIEKGVSGSVVLLPLRDRTIKIYTEIPEFVGDFDKIILPSLTFVP